MSDKREANAVDRRLGQRLRLRRLEIGMSQETLADLVGVTFQQVQKYEKGVNRIAASRLFEIAKAVDLPIAKFYDGVGAKSQTDIATPRAEFIDETLSTPDGMHLVTLFANIKSAKVRRRVLELVSAVVDDAQTRGA